MRILVYIIYWAFLVEVAFFPKSIYSDEILFHERSNNKMNMYSIKPDGSDLKSLGPGRYPQRSPDKNYLSYIKFIPHHYIISLWGQGSLVIKDLKRNVSFQVEDHLQGERFPIEHIICYCWSPDSKSVAFATLFGPGKGDGYICVFDLRTQKTRKVVQFRRDGVKNENIFISTRLEWSPDGKYLVFSSPVKILNDNKSIKLINPNNGKIKIIAKNSSFSSFINNKSILFVTGYEGVEGAEIWTMHIDGSEKMKIFNLKLPIILTSKAVNNKVIFQTSETKNGQPILQFLDIKEKYLITIKVEDYILLCPNISPDGNKMTVFGMNNKLGKGNIGFYIFDFETNNISLLKDLQYDELSEDKGFWFGALYGYGNSTNWN